MKKNMLRFIATAAALASVCTGSALHVSAEEITTPDRIMEKFNIESYQYTAVSGVIAVE